MVQIEYKTSHAVWYAMKASYGRALKAKGILDGMSIENYLPMCHRKVLINGRNKIKSVPAIPNLIFINTTLSQLKEVKLRIEYLHNMLIKSDENSAVLEPIIIQDQDMRQFINVVSSQDDAIYVDMIATPLKKGTRVRVIDGTFEGYEGVLMKVKGARERRVVVDIAGVWGVSMASISAELIEKI